MKSTSIKRKAVVAPAAGVEKTMSIAVAVAAAVVGVEGAATAMQRMHWGARYQPTLQAVAVVVGCRMIPINGIIC